jgi:hypothetical protein
MRIEFLASVILISTLLISCEKSIEDPLLRKDRAGANRNTSGKRLSYGDAIFYLGKTPNENRVQPVNKPDLQGKFVSIPGGLSLNKKTGEIDLSKSLTGQAYKIFYVTEDNRLIDSARIVISGIDYEDGLYTIARNSKKFGKKAEAYYNDIKENPLQNSFLNAFEIVGNNRKNVVINPRTGSIDLEASVEAGLFGSKKPRNGASVEIKLEYKLADRSRRNKNRTELKLYYFEPGAEVPDEIKKTFEMREYIKKRVDAMPPPGWSSTDAPEVGNLIEEDIMAYKVRPPLIVIN